MITNAFIIAFTSEFIPKIVYRNQLILVILVNNNEYIVDPLWSSVSKPNTFLVPQEPLLIANMLSARIH